MTDIKPGTGVLPDAVIDEFLRIIKWCDDNSWHSKAICLHSLFSRVLDHSAAQQLRIAALESDRGAEPRGDL